MSQQQGTTAEQGSKQADCIEADVQTAEKQTTVPGGTPV